MNRERILESIIIETTKPSFSKKESSESKFSPIIKEIGRELQITRIEAHHMFFFAYANYVKNLCAKSAVKKSKGKLTMDEYLDTVTHIGFIMIEAGSAYLVDRDFSLPEHYITTFLRSLKLFRAFPQCNLPVAIGMIQYCETDACFEMTASFLLDEVNTHNISLPVFMTDNCLKETMAFQSFIRTIFELNQSGQKQKFPSFEIVRIILNGPIVREPLDILIQLLDEKVVRDLSFYESDINALSHRLSIFGLFNEFMSRIDTLTNKEFETIQSMRQVMQRNEINYEIVQRVLEVKLDELNIENLVSFNSLLVLNRDARESYNDRYMVYCRDYVTKINSIILKCFDLASRTEDLLTKRHYMRTVLGLMSFVPKKNFYRQSPSINLDPLYDYFIDPVVNTNDFSLLDIDMLRITLRSKYVAVTSATLEKYYAAYIKFDFKIHTSISYAFATFLAMRMTDERSFISELKVFHQFIETLELDFTTELEIILSGLSRWDPIYKQEVLSYCREHRLISKTSDILLSINF